MYYLGNKNRSRVNEKKKNIIFNLHEIDPHLQTDINKIKNIYKFIFKKI
jgi:hypothetical protein